MHPLTICFAGIRLYGEVRNETVVIWALDMVIFNLIDPSCKYPYQQEIERDRSSCPLKTARESLGDLMRNNVCPSATPKYQILQATHWDIGLQVHELCVTFKGEERFRTVKQVNDYLQERQIDIPCRVINWPYPKRVVCRSMIEKLQRD